MCLSMDFLEFYKNKKIVIPGGNGFVGSHITQILKKIPCKVFVPRTKDGINFRKYEDCFSYLDSKKPQIVINCAAIQGGIAYHNGRQADLFMDNMLMGTFLMKASQAVGVGKFINVVAGCSYPGYLKKGEMNEEDYWSGKLHESIFSYGFARKTSTVYGLALKKQYNFNSIHLIMANMFGPGEHFNPEQSKALAGLIKKIYEAKKNKIAEVEVWGTGKPVRDWLYVKDGAEGILVAGAKYSDIEPINIATGIGISVKELAETVRQIIGYKGNLKYNTSKPDGAPHKTFGIHKMKRELQWVPETSVEAGIEETVEWFSKNYKKAIAY